jgi:hypothetical protein
MADWGVDSTSESVDERLDEFGSLVVNVSLAVDVLRWTAIAVQALGALGVLAWGFLTYVAWNRISGAEGVGQGGWQIKAASILSPISLLLLAALAVGVGTGCRLLAEWSAMRLADEYLEDDEADEPTAAD